MRTSLIQRYIAQGSYNFLINTVALQSKKLFAKIWKKLWDASCRRFKGPVSARIHGTKAIMNYGYTYPLSVRIFPYLNAPFVELAYQTWKAKGNKVTVADVGAAIGDTVLLLSANLPNAFRSFVCIDGDPEFFGYLEHNLQHVPEKHLICCLLSGADEEISDLVHIHTGTASSQSIERRTATTLSKVIKEEIDLLKIDVDGFDGRVLLGAADLLNRSHPSVIFEWHPILCQQTGNNWTDHFKVLVSSGYSRFLWFTKFGYFSHFSTGNSESDVNALAEYCLANVSKDWHYDIVALHDTSRISTIELANLSFAETRPSRI